MKWILLLLPLLFFSQNTLTYNDEKGSPNANLNDVKWLFGNWKGASVYGKCEENWSEPNGNTMSFNFKILDPNQKVFFYEFGHIAEYEKTIVLKILHFDGSLKPMLGMKDEFKFVKIEKNRVYFDGITYEKISDKQMNVYFYMEEDKKEVKFEFTK